METNFQTIAEFLKMELEKRLSRNAHYSLRAFARDLEVTPPRLSRVLNQKRGISKQAAEQLANRLGLSENEKKYFIQLTEANHSRSRKAKESAQKNIAEISSQYQNLDEDTFKIISDWQHFALLTYLGLKNKSHSILSLSKSLGITQFQVKQSLKRLENN